MIWLASIPVHLCPFHLFGWQRPQHWKSLTQKLFQPSCVCVCVCVCVYGHMCMNAYKRKSRSKHPMLSMSCQLGNLIISLPSEQQNKNIKKKEKKKIEEAEGGLVREKGKTGRGDKQGNWLNRENVTLFLVWEMSYLLLFLIFVVGGCDLSGGQPNTEALQCCMTGRAEFQCMSSTPCSYQIGAWVEWTWEPKKWQNDIIAKKDRQRDHEGGGWWNVHYSFKTIRRQQYTGRER